MPTDRMTNLETGVKLKVPDKYPEHTRLIAVSEKSQAIGEFLVFMEHQHGARLMTAQQDGWGGTYMARHSGTINEWLADFFKIDLKKIDAEKEAMLEELRSNGNAD